MCLGNSEVKFDIDGIPSPPVLSLSQYQRGLLGRLNQIKNHPDWI